MRPNLAMQLRELARRRQHALRMCARYRDMMKSARWWGERYSHRCTLLSYQGALQCIRIDRNLAREWAERTQ